MSQYLLTGFMAIAANVFINGVFIRVSLGKLTIQQVIVAISEVNFIFVSITEVDVIVDQQMLNVDDVVLVVVGGKSFEQCAPIFFSCRRASKSFCSSLRLLYD